MTSVEGAILVWLAIGVGIAGGVFILARSAQTTLLSLAMVAALIVRGQRPDQ